MPTYQRRDLACSAVRAAGRIEYRGELELVVVVDGSTDETAEALAKIELPFPFSIITQENRGAASARNAGAARAKGDILLFLDDDMICAPDLVEQHARSYAEGADAVVGNIPVHPSSDRGFLTQATVQWIESWNPGQQLTPFDIFTGQLSVRRSVFEELGGFDEGYTTSALFAHEDTDFGARLLAKHQVRYNPDAISAQTYVVRPREILDRSKKAAAADARFARSHPEHARALMDYRGFSRKRTRYVYKPLSRVPLLSDAATRIVAPLSEVILRSPMRSSRLMSKIFGFTQGLAYWSGARAADAVEDGQRLLVLCYHAIRDQSDDPVLAPYGTAPEQFRDQLDELAIAGFTFVSAGAAAAFLRDQAPLPRRAVLLTFDDCYVDLLAAARDILQPRGIPALAFAVSGVPSNTNEWDQTQGAQRHALLDAEQLKSLAGLGVEVGSHSRTHRDMTCLSAREQREEVSGSADDLERIGLPRPRFFAYPFGAADNECRKAVEDAGYFAAFGCATGLVDVASDRFDLPRVGVFAADRGWRFRLKTSWPRLHRTATMLQQGIIARIARPDGGSSDTY